MATNPLLRRTLSIVAIGVAVTLSLVGCGDDDEDATPSSRRRTTSTEPRSTTETTGNETTTAPSTTDGTDRDEEGNVANDPGTTAAPEPPPTTAAPTTAAPTTAAPTTQDPSTTPPASEGASSPGEAAATLVQAWKAGDRQRARGVAAPGAVDALFSRTASSEASPSKCRQDGAVWACPVLNSGDPFVIRVEGSSAYRAVEIAFFDD